MLKGIVTATIVSTRKCEKLVGCKFLEIDLIEKGKYINQTIIAVDSVGAGIGENVLITTGSSARAALKDNSMPVDAVVVGIID